MKRISQLSSDLKLFVSTTGTSSEDPKRPAVAVIEEILDELEGITVTTELLKVLLTHKLNPFPHLFPPTRFMIHSFVENSIGDSP